MSVVDDKHFPYPMRIQVAAGSEAELRYNETAAGRINEWAEREALAPGISPSPADDLVFRGGKVLPQMGFQNIYLGRPSDFASDDVQHIDDAIARVMHDENLKSIIQQYFPGKNLDYDVAPSVVLDETKAKEMDESDVQNKIIDLFDQNLILSTDEDRTVFNLVLAPDTVLKLDDSSSREGLGGYHGSVHFSRNGKAHTLYYSANVYSAVRSGQANGIPFFKDPWKNVVCTLYHELIESQTDPDVGDAIREMDRQFIGFNSNRGQEIGDQPISANALKVVFKEVLTLPGPRLTPVQLLYSNAVHGAEAPSEHQA